MELMAGAVTLGLAYGFLALGVFLTVRIFRFPDITVDGSFTLGASVFAVLLSVGFPTLPACAVSVAAGCIAGAITGVVHTALRIGGLLSGILVMTALYTVNLRVMGRPNIAITRDATTGFGSQTTSPILFLDHQLLMIFATVSLLIWIGLYLLLRTDFGLALRAAGSNPVMVAAQGARVGLMTVTGVALANGLAALSGACVALYQGFVDVNMGFGMIVLGLASVFLGEAIVGRRSLLLILLGPLLGALLFRLLITLALTLGIGPRDLKMLTAAFVLGALIFSRTARRLASGQLAVIRKNGER